MFLPYAIKLDGFTMRKSPPYDHYVPSYGQINGGKKVSQWRNSFGLI